MVAKSTQTQKEILPVTSTVEPYERPENVLWAAAWLAERTKPSRQRNLTPLQRKQRAEALKLFRRARSGDPDLIVRS